MTIQTFSDLLYSDGYADAMQGLDQPAKADDAYMRGFNAALEDRDSGFDGMTATDFVESTWSVPLS